MCRVGGSAIRGEGEGEGEGEVAMRRLVGKKEDEDEDEEDVDDEPWGYVVFNGKRKRKWKRKWEPKGGEVSACTYIHTYIHACMIHVKKELQSPKYTSCRVSLPYEAEYYLSIIM